MIKQNRFFGTRTENKAIYAWKSNDKVKQLVNNVSASHYILVTIRAIQVQQYTLDNIFIDSYLFGAVFS